jgi:hypothetical protein
VCPPKSPPLEITIVCYYTFGNLIYCTLGRSIYTTWYLVLLFVLETTKEWFFNIGGLFWGHTVYKNIAIKTLFTLEKNWERHGKKSEQVLSLLGTGRLILQM